MSGKRVLWHNKKHWWHLSSSKVRRLTRLYEQLEVERVEPYKVELMHVKIIEKK